MTGGMIVVLEIYVIVLLIIIDLIAGIIKAMGRREASQRKFRAVLPDRGTGAVYQQKSRNMESRDATEVLH